MAIIFTLNHHPSSQTRADGGDDDKNRLQMSMISQKMSPAAAARRWRFSGTRNSLNTSNSLPVFRVLRFFLHSSLSMLHIFTSFLIPSTSLLLLPRARTLKAKQQHTRMHAVSTHCEPASDKRCFLL